MLAAQGWTLVTANVPGPVNVCILSFPHEVIVPPVASIKLEAVSVTANKPSLDDVFLEVTGYRLEGATEEEGLKEEVSENE